MPKVSILTALYNHEKYIAQAIESVLAQTYSDWELLIWDDGSKDHSLETAQKYEKQFPEKIKVYTHPNHSNLGQEVTRNAAIQKAHGEFLCLLDSDDFYAPTKLEVLVPEMKDPDVGLVYGRADIQMEASGKILPSGIQRYFEGQVFGELIQENFLAAGAVLFRRECLGQEGRFDFRYRTCGEYPVWLQIARDWKFAYVPEVVAYWRNHGENLGTKLSVTAKAELVDLCERLLNDPQYTMYKSVISKALAKKRYDYANELYNDLDLSAVKRECQRVLLSSDSDVPVRVKAGVLWGLSGLGVIPNRVLSKAKRSFWEWRNPHAKNSNNNSRYPI